MVMDKCEGGCDGNVLMQQINRLGLTPKNKIAGVGKCWCK